jgi:thiamine phosphate synthase YjbQ (UPF0047 family)
MRLDSHRRRFLAAIVVVVVTVVATPMMMIPAGSFPLAVVSSSSSLSSSHQGREEARSRCFGRSTLRSPFMLSAKTSQGEGAAAAAAAAASSARTDASSQPLSSALSVTGTAEEGSSTGSIRVTATHRPSNLRERQPVCVYHEISVSPPATLPGPNPKQDGDATPQQVISTRDLTPILKQLISQSGIQYGTVTVVSRHTTTSIVINEQESRLAQDVANHLLQLAPIDERSAHPLRRQGTRYLHNDIDQRPDSPEEFQRCLDNGYDVRDPHILQQWRDQEPINAHSHLLSMLLGSSESVPIVNGTMAIGQWQSVLLVDLDGTRTRTVGVNLVGYR